MTIETIWFASAIFTYLFFMHSFFFDYDRKNISTEEAIWYCIGLLAISAFCGLFIAPAIVLIGCIRLLADIIDSI